MIINDCPAVERLRVSIHKSYGKVVPTSADIYYNQFPLKFTAHKKNIVSHSKYSNGRFVLVEILTNS